MKNTSYGVEQRPARQAHNLEVGGSSPFPVTILKNILFLCVLGVLCGALLGCTDFEHAAYKTLAVSQAEYELLQQRMAEAAVHELITEDQWNRFAAAGHTFIAAHNAAVEAFNVYGLGKTKQQLAQAQAAIEELPKLIREINDMVKTFQREPAQPSLENPTAEQIGI